MPGLCLLLGLFLAAPVAVVASVALASVEACDHLRGVCPEVRRSIGADIESLLESQSGLIADEIEAEIVVKPAFTASVSLLLDASNRLVADKINALSRRIDEFLADEKLFYESSGSYIRLTADSVWYQQEDSGFIGSVRLKLKLPRSKDKYKFTFESEPERLDADLDNNVRTNPVDAADKQDYFAGFQALVWLVEHWRYRTSIGVKLRSPVDSYFRLGARGDYTFKHWSLILEESMSWFDQSGRVFISSLELNRGLAGKLLFRSSTRAHWTETDAYFRTSQIFSLFQRVDKNRLVSFYAGVYGVTEPKHHVTDYRVSASFRRNLRQQYLFLELIPQIRYQKINDFNPEWGFVFRLEWVFHG